MMSDFCSIDDYIMTNSFTIDVQFLTKSCIVNVQLMPVRSLYDV